MFGRRSDGRRLDNIDPIVQIMPYLMTERNDAMNMLTLYLDYDPMMEYIRKRSLWLDFIILLKTVETVLHQRDAK